MATCATAKQTHSWAPSEPPQSASKKAVPINIKKRDAEPLTRRDIQYDFLCHVFSDRTAAFTAQDGFTKLTFRELYIEALSTSTKCSKSLKDKMVETVAFADELAQISLLTNVGRINTTMAFFPEMRTALRSYHPVPSIQKTDGNLQDAPRLKSCLKGCLLPDEFHGHVSVPATPEEVLARLNNGKIPPTTVVNLIFILVNHAIPLSPVHFGNTGLTLLDLFLPKPLSSASRARAFLWHIFHYLEGSSGNPWQDMSDYGRTHLDEAPRIHPLSPRDVTKENVDSPEEIAWAKHMSGVRNTFLQKLVFANEYEKQNEQPGQVKEQSHTPVLDLAKHRRTRLSAAVVRQQDGTTFPHYVPAEEREQDPLDAASPRPFLPIDKCPSPNKKDDLSRTSMLHQAWYMATCAIDSDEEHDEYVQADYKRRLEVLARLRGVIPVCPYLHE